MARYPQENVPKGYIQGPRDVASIAIECRTCDSFSAKVYDDHGAQSGKCFVDYGPETDPDKRVRYVDGDGLCPSWRSSDPLALED